MRAVAQRVSWAQVHVGEEKVGSIDEGLLVYLGIAKEDTFHDVAAMANKLAGLRVFETESGRMSLSIEDIKGAILLVPQFTLFGDVRRGLRPSFDGAAPPEIAEDLCDQVGSALKQRGLHVETGRFRATMRVSSEVRGPVTILIDTTKLF